MSLTQPQAQIFVELPLHALRREYPNHIMHLLNGPQDVLSPRALHPVFYGCYDWHSAVHGYWLLARCAQAFPALPQHDAIIALFDEHFTANNLAQELAYFEADGRTPFERPYGYAWLLALAQAMSEWQHPRAAAWRTLLEPLVQLLRRRTMAYFTALSYPLRVGTHYNSAFALQLTLDYALHDGDDELVAAVKSAATRFYLADTDYPAHYEPGGDEFLSGAMTEALLMSHVIEPDRFGAWFERYLPRLADMPQLLTPATVSDRTDPKIAHLDGLNLSRAWCMKQVAARLPADAPSRHQLLRAAGAHINASLPHVTSGHYAGEHWLATFALLALQPV